MLSVREPLEATESTDKFDIEATADGGGITGQAGALRLGHRARAGQDRRAVSSDAQGPRPPHARSAHERAQEVRPRGSSQAVPVLEALRLARRSGPRCRWLPKSSPGRDGIGRVRREERVQFINHTPRPERVAPVLRSWPGSAIRAVEAQPKTERGHYMGELTLQESARSGRSLRPPDQAVEPEDEALSFCREERHPHHRPREDALTCLNAARDADPRGGVGGEAGALRRHQAAGQARDQRRSGALRHALRDRALARRHADQLQYRAQAVLGRLEYLEKMEARRQHHPVLQEGSLRLRQGEGAHPEDARRHPQDDGSARAWCSSSTPRRSRTPSTKRAACAIPIVGVVDSNADPEEVDYPVPGNDDAMRAIGLFARIVADACIEGRVRFTEGRDVSSGDSPILNHPCLRPSTPNRLGLASWMPDALGASR